MPEVFPVLILTLMIFVLAGCSVLVLHSKGRLITALKTHNDALIELDKTQVAEIQALEGLRDAHLRVIDAYEDRTRTLEATVKLQESLLNLQDSST